MILVRMRNGLEEPRMGQGSQTLFRGGRWGWGRLVAAVRCREQVSKVLKRRTV